MDAQKRTLFYYPPPQYLLSNSNFPKKGNVSLRRKWTYWASLCCSSYDNSLWNKCGKS